MSVDRWTKVHTAESVFEMETIKEALEREDIECIVRQHRDTAYDGLFILQKGYASFLVRQKDEPAAKEIIERVKSLSHVVLSDD
jgi:hypothetical protein